MSLSSAQAFEDMSLTCQPLTAMDGLTDNYSQAVLLLPDERVAVGTWGNINIYDGSLFTHADLSTRAVYPLPHAKPMSQMGLDSHDRLWMKRITELWCLDLRRGAFVEPLDSLLGTLLPPRHEGDSVRELLVDGQRHLWLYRQGQLYDADHQAAIQLPDGAGHVCGVERDEHHVYVFDDQGRCLLYDAKSLRLEKQVQSAPLDDASQYWGVQTVRGADGCFYQLFFGRKSSLYRFDPKQGESQLVYRADRLVRFFALSPDGHLWLCHRAGIYVITTSGEELTHYDRFLSADGTDLGEPDVCGVCFDNYNNVWIAMGSGGLYYAHFCSHRLTSAPTLTALGLPESYERDFHQRRAPQFSDAAGHPTNDELRDRRGWTWKATSRGLLMELPGKPARLLNERDGLPSDYIHSLAEDADGDIWMATSRGIVSLHTGEEGDGQPQLLFTVYDQSDGCLASEYYPRNAMCLDDGRILMAGHGGWTVFDPRKVRKQWGQLSPRILRLQVNNQAIHARTHGDDGISMEQSLPYADEITLAYNQNQLTFDVSAFYYSHPQQTVYRWRLVNGKDGQWQQVSYYKSGLVDKNGMLHLSMMNLPPGKYRLEVMASTDGQHFSDHVARFSFRIRPPWWQTWWAYTLYIILALGLLLTGFWLYLRDQRRTLEWKRQEEVLNLRIDHLLELASQPETIIAEETADEEKGQRDDEETAAAPDEAPGEPPVAEPRLSEKDQQFVNQAVELIERHLTDTYTVEQLASDLCMERTGLYKRLTALIDQSPQTFIRSIRLNRAAELLRQEDRSIADVTYAVGFSSPSYFVKCFREKYGCTPGEWRQAAG